MQKPLGIQKCELPTNLPTDTAKCSRVSTTKNNQRLQSDSKHGSSIFDKGHEPKKCIGIKNMDSRAVKKHVFLEPCFAHNSNVCSTAEQVNILNVILNMENRNFSILIGYNFLFNPMTEKMLNV